MTDAEKILMHSYGTKVVKQRVSETIMQARKQYGKCASKPPCTETKIPVEQWCERCRMIHDSNALMFKLKAEFRKAKKAVRQEAKRLYELHNT